ncbi:putative Superoxide dismutase copper chaperone Lys7 [Taphrina deformans PYCC 5710]|uniref:Superoxide dismutase 1 copper chaperone n=1 Tax=Taphrina deformans (strain PYCC 5710 / ATCC 11124 / CBS 356.35 / IMI 108563 / JCM 9778 / NBRC 8474) TaxID=1097556 RepID=R4X7J7_TAPDE|nr:putative Superoxide dismutase copper chaperone Lys7 [Taphrina deformans PYCC 5710]|eukprot:CCG81370.1 putative Superoxide dismutase copper chaperone Lys7 [Taphrina deformans PYCC 5710]
MSFRTEYMVSMTCQGCVDSITKALATVPGIERYEVNLSNKTVLVEGTASPARTAQTLQDLGRTAIVRGLGSKDGAAVCILEKHDPTDSNMNVFGLARFVEASASLTLCDLTVRGLPRGQYEAHIYTTGDVRNGMHTAGSIWDRGYLGGVDVNGQGKGQILLEKKDLRIWEIIGRALVLKMKDEQTDNIAGVIARSAGLWENQKTVCTCSGQNVWDERQEMLKSASTL